MSAIRKFLHNVDESTKTLTFLYAELKKVTVACFLKLKPNVIKYDIRTQEFTANGF